MSGLFPSFSSSDREFDLTYDYICELFNKHIKSVPSGHVVTEFLKDVPWAGIYNTINCAALHHFRELSLIWLLQVSAGYVLLPMIS